MASNLEKRVEELEKTVQMLLSKKRIKIKKNLGIGDTFELCGLTWKILDITEKGYMCLAERLGDTMMFDSSSNDWKSSGLREYLNKDFYKNLCGKIGAENIVSFERDLLSLDGQTEYGKCEDNVSLITFDEYRKYRSLIPNTENYSWWTCTPDSTKCNEDSTWVRVVSSSGGIDYGVYYYDNGVRPVCIFDSSIFESED